MKFTFVSVISDIAEYFISVTFHFGLRNSQKIVEKLSQTFFVFISMRIVVDSVAQIFHSCAKKIARCWKNVIRLQNHIDFGMFALFLSYICIF